jgi:hypothetical protein
MLTHLIDTTAQLDQHIHDAPAGEATDRTRSSEPNRHKHPRSRARTLGERWQGPAGAPAVVTVVTKVRSNQRSCIEH